MLVAWMLAVCQVLCTGEPIINACTQQQVQSASGALCNSLALHKTPQQALLTWLRTMCL
jgi:hypothetical protein